MRDYEFCPPENPNWCVPSGLQTLMKSRRINVAQEEIAQFFPEYLDNSAFDGFNFNKYLFGKFLDRFGLKCDFHNPHDNIESYKDCDIFLRDSKGDILVAYNSLGNSHLSVLSDFSFDSKLVKLIDFEIPINLSNIVRNMDPSESKSYGFYVIR
ncbi:MAG: hypothetical protein AABY03_01910 [Nanoarchaeota archaeon]